jgi:antitoxin (DNA-binding transcriptional repressor) of toxin-antitoxin stability system
LIKRVLKGEKIIIASHGKPLVSLEKIKKQSAKRIGGQFQGTVWMADDFDSLPNDFLKSFSRPSNSKI